MPFIISAHRGAKKTACLFIVMLLVASFQLHGLGLAANGFSRNADGWTAEILAAAPPHPEAGPSFVSPSSSLATDGAKSTSGSPRDGAGDTTEDAEVEAINNILGAPVLTPTENKAAPGARVQKHVSLLDNASSEATTSSIFDYGVYTSNLRLLETYRDRVRETIETARQLSLPVSTDVVEGLLKEAHNHKRAFERLYPSPNEEDSKQGLLEWEQARKGLLHALALVSPSPKVEGRAIWLDRETIIRAANPDGLKALLQRLHHSGINIIYFETLNAGFPIYPSKILAPNPLVKDWDPLAVAVKEGDLLGMEVHAWVWVFAVGNRRHNPLIGMPDSYAGPILTKSPYDCEALRNASGGLSVDSRQHEYWLSPASPRARALLLSVYEEIVRRYDVAGIHLDYIRYPFQTPGTRMGYEAAGRNGFHQATGRTLDGPVDGDTLRLWTAWKTLQVNSFVQQVSNRLRRIKPPLQISAAVFPMRRASRLVAIQQDWETWINNGWVDTLSPMSYTTDPMRLQSLYESVRNSPQRRPLIYPGVALNRLDDGQLVLQLEALREKGSLGSTLFAGAHLSADKEETLATGPYKQGQSLPPHRNIFLSLGSVLDDYRQSFERVMAASPPPAFSAQSLQQVRSAMDGLHSELTGMRDGYAIPCGIPGKCMDDLQQRYQALQQANQAWLETDREKNPLRARYFDRTLYTFSELLDYLNDKNATASRIVPADEVPVGPVNPDIPNPNSTGTASLLETPQPLPSVQAKAQTEYPAAASPVSPVLTPEIMSPSQVPSPETASPALSTKTPSDSRLAPAPVPQSPALTVPIQPAMTPVTDLPATALPPSPAPNVSKSEPTPSKIAPSEPVAPVTGNASISDLETPMPVPQLTLPVTENPPITSQNISTPVSSPNAIVPNAEIPVTTLQTTSPLSPDDERGAHSSDENVSFPSIPYESLPGGSSMEPNSDSAEILPSCEAQNPPPSENAPFPTGVNEETIEPSPL
jgi:uncharacterized lipoprotein YddW (UPF0748 family)